MKKKAILITVIILAAVFACVYFDNSNNNNSNVNNVNNNESQLKIEDPNKETEKTYVSDELEEICVSYAKDSTNRYGYMSQTPIDLSSDFYITKSNVNRLIPEDEYSLKFTGTIKRNLMSLSTVYVVTVALDKEKNIIKERTSNFIFNDSAKSGSFDLTLECGTTMPKYYKLYLSW